MVIAVDLGGTNIRAARVEKGIVSYRLDAVLHDKHLLQSTVDQVCNLISQVMDGGISGIGIGVPSIVEEATGTVCDVTNIPSWKRVPLRQILSDRFGIPVQVNNDVNCFVLGEHRYGVAKGFSNAIGLAVGTGLGGGVILNNQLYSGRNGGAGEFGLVPYLDANIETYCSGGFFSRKYGISAVEAFNLAEQGNKEAAGMWNEFGKHMGYAIQTVVYTYDPEVIVLGGSLLKAFRHFKPAMQETFSGFEFPESINRLHIFASELEHAALIGAASLVE